MVKNNKRYETFVLFLFNFYLLLTMLSNTKILGNTNKMRLAILIYLGIYMLINFLKFNKIGVICRSRLSKWMILYLLYIFIVFFINMEFNIILLKDHLFIVFSYFLGRLLFYNFKLNHLNNFLKVEAGFLIVYFIFYVYSLLYPLTSKGFLVNNIYFLLVLVPYIFLLSKNIIKKIMIALLFLAVGLSQKRSAILMILFVSRLSRIKKRKFVKKVFVSILLIVMIIILNIMLKKHFGLDNFERFHSLIKDKGSGRYDLSMLFLKKYSSVSFIKKILGNGPIASSNFLGSHSVHNDILEMLWRFGWIGLGMFFSLLYILVKKIKRLKQISITLKNSYISFLIIFLFLIIFSQVLFVSTYVGYLSLYLGLIESFHLKSLKKRNSSLGIA